MEVEFTSHFLKKAKRLTPETKRKLVERTIWFQKNPNDPRLKTHRLSGKLNGAFAFSVTFSIRVIFKPGGSGKSVFLDVGGHDDVYRL